MDGISRGHIPVIAEWLPPISRPQESVCGKNSTSGIAPVTRHPQTRTAKSYIPKGSRVLIKDAFVADIRKAAGIHQKVIIPRIIKPIVRKTKKSAPVLVESQVTMQNLPRFLRTKRVAETEEFGGFLVEVPELQQGSSEFEEIPDWEILTESMYQDPKNLHTDIGITIHRTRPIFNDPDKQRRARIWTIDPDDTNLILDKERGDLWQSVCEVLSETNAAAVGLSPDDTRNPAAFYHFITHENCPLLTACYKIGYYVPAGKEAGLLGGVRWYYEGENVLCEILPKNGIVGNGVKNHFDYIGTLYSQFGIHVEDFGSRSISYRARDESSPGNKYWYITAARFRDQVEKVLSDKAEGSDLQIKPDRKHPMWRSMCAENCKYPFTSPAHKETTCDPDLLEEHGIPIFEIRQTPGSFVVTHKMAAHFGFNATETRNRAINFMLGPEDLPDLKEFEPCPKDRIATKARMKKAKRMYEDVRDGIGIWKYSLSVTVQRPDGNTKEEEVPVYTDCTVKTAKQYFVSAYGFTSEDDVEISFEETRNKIIANDELLCKAVMEFYKAKQGTVLYVREIPKISQRFSEFSSVADESQLSVSPQSEIEELNEDMGSPVNVTDDQIWKARENLRTKMLQDGVPLLVPVASLLRNSPFTRPLNEGKVDEMFQNIAGNQVAVDRIWVLEVLVPVQCADPKAVKEKLEQGNFEGTILKGTHRHAVLERMGILKALVCFYIDLNDDEQRSLINARSLNLVVEVDGTHHIRRFRKELLTIAESRAKTGGFVIPSDLPLTAVMPGQKIPLLTNKDMDTIIEKLVENCPNQFRILREKNGSFAPLRYQLRSALKKYLEFSVWSLDDEAFALKWLNNYDAGVNFEKLPPSALEYGNGFFKTRFSFTQARSCLDPNISDIKLRYQVWKLHLSVVLQERSMIFLSGQKFLQHPMVAEFLVVHPQLKGTAHFSQTKRIAISESIPVSAIPSYPFIVCDADSQTEDQCYQASISKNLQISEKVDQVLTIPTTNKSTQGSCSKGRKRKKNEDSSYRNTRIKTLSTASNVSAHLELSSQISEQSSIRISLNGDKSDGSETNHDTINGTKLCNPESKHLSSGSEDEEENEDSGQDSSIHDLESKFPDNTEDNAVVTEANINLVNAEDIDMPAISTEKNVQKSESEEKESQKVSDNFRETVGTGNNEGDDEESSRFDLNLHLGTNFMSTEHPPEKVNKTSCPANIKMENQPDYDASVPSGYDPLQSLIPDKNHTETEEQPFTHLPKHKLLFAAYELARFVTRDEQARELLSMTGLQGVEVARRFYIPTIMSMLIQIRASEEYMLNHAKEGEFFFVQVGETVFLLRFIRAHQGVGVGRSYGFVSNMERQFTAEKEIYHFDFSEGIPVNPRLYILKENTVTFPIAQYRNSLLHSLKRRFRTARIPTFCKDSNGYFEEFVSSDEVTS